MIWAIFNLLDQFFGAFFSLGLSWLSVSAIYPHTGNYINTFCQFLQSPPEVTPHHFLYPFLQPLLWLSTHVHKVMCFSYPRSALPPHITLFLLLVEGVRRSEGGEGEAFRGHIMFLALSISLSSIYNIIHHQFL